MELLPLNRQHSKAELASTRPPPPRPPSAAAALIGQKTALHKDSAARVCRPLRNRAPNPSRHVPCKEGIGYKDDAARVGLTVDVESASFADSRIIGQKAGPDNRIGIDAADAAI